MLDADDKAIDLLQIKTDEDTPDLLNQKTDPVPLIPVTMLPSGFKGYPEGTKISYQPITLGELEALNTGEMDVTRAIGMLLLAIDCNTLPPEELYYWDVMYIGIQRKLQAFGGTKGMIYSVCPHCGTQLQKTFDYTELDFKECEAPALPMKLTIAGKQVEFGLMTMKSFLELKLEEGERGVYARMIKNLPYEEAYELTSNAYGLDIKKLRFVDEKLDYGLKPFFVTCPGTISVQNEKYDPDKPTTKNNQPFITKPCEAEVAMEVKSPFEVVFPEDEDTDDIGFEVQYG